VGRFKYCIKSIEIDRILKSYWTGNNLFIDSNLSADMNIRFKSPLGSLIQWPMKKFYYKGMQIYIDHKNLAIKHLSLDIGYNAAAM
jgi:hypothetical protein